MIDTNYLHFKFVFMLLRGPNFFNKKKKEKEEEEERKYLISSNMCRLSIMEIIRDRSFKSFESSNKSLYRLSLQLQPERDDERGTYWR